MIGKDNGNGNDNDNCSGNGNGDGNANDISEEETKELKDETKTCITTQERLDKGNAKTRLWLRLGVSVSVC